MLREPELEIRQAAFDRIAWLREQGIAHPEQARLVSLFCYEPQALAQMLVQWAAGPIPTHVLVTAGRATAALPPALRNAALSDRVPHVPQPEFDHLLGLHLNFVRGRTPWFARSGPGSLHLADLPAGR